MILISFTLGPDTEPAPEELVPAEVTVSTGYVESKWVCEQILNKVASQSHMKTLSVRVGQLCGGINGAWNTKEWVPSMVQSAQIVGCIPDDNKVCLIP